MPYSQKASTVLQPPGWNQGCEDDHKLYKRALLLHSSSRFSISHPMDDLILEDMIKGEQRRRRIDQGDSGGEGRSERETPSTVRDLEMKISNSSSAEGSGNDQRVRSASDKEKTKLRERKRRAITTKIFHGLRRHGGYKLPPRADINDVLRHLAGEAGWVIESDGTTYRTKGPVPHQCPACGYCGVSNTRSLPVATGSYAIGCGGGGGGDCSTTASPRQTAIIQQPSPSSSDAAAGAASGHRFDVVAASSSSNRVAVPERDVSPALSMGDEVAAYLIGGTEAQRLTSAYYGAQNGVAGGADAFVMISGQHQKAYLQEARASNRSTPIGSPQSFEDPNHSSAGKVGQ
ncbi:hypothetical protein H6P81_019289 [Aristolochia fimbriata]|uniref:Protein BZR1 homolog n=1 Tax=Aristolochia fimbriata TaxID=158543 RepID=A0AAV7DS66_ARIFI|nr:hypothetical protein H6P81_019289 [Aristolochia fimbriata]